MNYTVGTVLGVLSINYEVIARGEEGFDSINIKAFKVKFFGEEPKEFSDFLSDYADVPVASYNIDLDDELITLHKKI
jgi:hypothetical protein